MNNVDEQVAYWLLFIKNRMKEMNLDAKDVFINGDCGNLYTIFSKIFKEKAIPYRINYMEEPMHIVTKIGEKLYDINGEASLEKYCEYATKNNRGTFDLKDFTLSLADYWEVHQQSDKYKYDEQFRQSEIDKEMSRLEKMIEDKIKEKETEMKDNER